MFLILVEGNFIYYNFQAYIEFDTYRRMQNNIHCTHLFIFTHINNTSSKNLILKLFKIIFMSTLYVLMYPKTNLYYHVNQSKNTHHWSVITETHGIVIMRHYIN